MVICDNKQIFKSNIESAMFYSQEEPTENSQIEVTATCTIKNTHVRK